MKKIKFFTIAALMMGLVACQKEDNTERTSENKPAPTKQELLAAKTWTLTGMTISPAMMGVTDIFPMIDPCEKDNTWKFNNDAGHTMVIDEGSNICQGAHDRTTTTWSLNSAGNMITIDKYEYSINDIKAEGFNIQENIEKDGKSYTVTSTYSAK